MCGQGQGRTADLPLFRLDILVNNAGVCDDGPLEDQTLDELNTVVQVNLVRRPSRAAWERQHAVTVVLVALGAAIGAPVRYRSTGPSRLGIPWGTLIDNVAGSALLGFLAAAPGRSGPIKVDGTAFCGALTTYSTFSYETLKLAEDKAIFLTLNAAANIIAALGAAYFGMAVAQAITR